MQGYHMLVAENGAAALRLAKEHKAEIDLLITDLIMPGMGGRDVARKIRRMRPETSVLYISGYTDTALQHSGALQRSMSFLGKPFTPEALSRKVREVLEAQEPEAGERHQVVR
jgi:response regulator RpfG family c-di-GMP phosphodiesterase